MQILYMIEPVTIPRGSNYPNHQSLHATLDLSSYKTPGRVRILVKCLHRNLLHIKKTSV